MGMRRVLLLVTAAVVVIAVFAMAGVSLAADETEKGCGPDLSLIDSDGRLLWTSLEKDHVDPQGKLWTDGAIVACDPEVGEWREILNEAEDGELLNTALAQRGSMLAYSVQVNCEQPCYSTEYRVMDVATGKLLTAASPFGSESFYYYVEYVAEVAANGSLVMSVMRRNENNKSSKRRRIVKFGPRDRDRILDGGSGIKLSSLSVRGNTATWLKWQSRRSASLK